MVATVVYCRISRDREGSHLGVKRQEDDCVALAGRLGWQVVDVIIDNDRSAYSGRARPGYEQMLADIEHGRYQAVVAWHPDRLHRSPTELERFIDVIESTGTQVATCQAGPVDLSSPAGRMTARVVGAVARHESEHKAARLQRKHLELAMAGKSSGGGRRPFGYRRVLDTSGRISHFEIDEEEAEHIREAVRRVLAGDGVRTICRDWRLRGVATVTGAVWSQTTVRRMLASGRIAGMRMHRGEMVAEAEWPAILSVDELLQVRAALDARSTAPGSRARTYLLAGLLICGACSRKLGVRPSAQKKRRYACTIDRGGCNNVGVSADGLEGFIVDAALTVLDTPALAESVQRKSVEANQVGGDLAGIDTRLDELAALWAGGSLTMREWTAAREALQKRRESAEDRLRHVALRGATAELIGAGGALRDTWENLSFDQRRGVLVAVIDSIVIAPRTRAMNRFDPDRVDVRWKV